MIHDWIIRIGKSNITFFLLIGMITLSEMVLIYHIPKEELKGLAEDSYVRTVIRYMDHLLCALLGLKVMEIIGGVLMDHQEKAEEYPLPNFSELESDLFFSTSDRQQRRIINQFIKRHNIESDSYEMDRMNEILKRIRNGKET